MQGMLNVGALQCVSLSFEQGPRCRLSAGSNRGLGLEAAKQLAKAGYKLILTGRNAYKGEGVVFALFACFCLTGLQGGDFSCCNMA